MSSSSDPATVPALEARRVSKVFHSASRTRRRDDGSSKTHDGVTALQDASLAVAPGETVVLVGESGSGKTTMLRLFNRLEVATAGEVLVAGEPVESSDPIE